MPTDEPATNSPADVGYAPAPAIPPASPKDAPPPELTTDQAKVLRAVRDGRPLKRKMMVLLAMSELARMRCIRVVFIDGNPDRYGITLVGLSALAARGDR